MLYQVGYQASLLHWKSNAYTANYVMQMLKMINLQIMHYGKIVLSW